MLIDFDIKEKIKELKKQGKPAPKEYFDLGIAYWLINPDEYKEFRGKKEDLDKLYKFAIKKLKEHKLEKLFYEVEMPLMEVLADMELLGIKLDIKNLKNLEKDLGKKLISLTKAIYEEASQTFNINSPKQLGEILFKKLKIDTRGVRKTRGGAISTDIDTLLTIKERHPIVKHILEYRELFKLLSTYVQPLQQLTDRNKRVHTTYLQTGTATGRLSSQNPNLQNIPASAKATAGKPIGSKWATELRKSFIPEKGYKLVAFDYSQIELRVLASLSGDPKMMEAFNNDQDIHSLTAAKVFNTSLDKVTPEMRRMAKTLNFGIVYGMGANAFAKTSGLDFVEAKRFIEEYFHNFQKIKEWQEKIKSQARTDGYVTNLNGRRRWFLEAVSMYRSEAAEAERAAINMPVQGLAADIIKIAMIKIANELKKKKLWGDQVRLLLTIHDELLFEVKDNMVKEITKLIPGLMESAYELEVPIKVDAKVGKNWGEL